MVRFAMAVVVCGLLLAILHVRLLESTAVAQQPAPVAQTAAGNDAASNERDVAHVIKAEPESLVLDCQAVDEETGKPVAGAAVEIKWDSDSQPNDNERLDLHEKRLQTKTAADGTYRVVVPAWTRDRPELSVRVQMTHDSYLHYWDVKPLKDLLGDDPAKRLTDFERAKLTPGREITGRVVNPLGMPLKDVMLSKEYFKQPVVNDASLRIPRDADSIRTDSEGRFRCLVRAKGYVAIRFRTSPELVEQPVEISAERDQGDIQLAYGTRFTGRVLTSTGEPLANAYVMVTIPNVNGAPNTYCDAEGRFTTTAFGSGKHTLSVGWVGASWIPPELYLPVEFELDSGTTTRHVDFRPIDSVRVIAKVVKMPPRTANPQTDVPLRLHTVQVRGNYLGKPWLGGGIDLHDDGSGRSHPPRAPRGLTDVELWFEDLPQRIQQHGDAPLLFGSALQLPRLDNDLDDLRIHRYAPTIVKLSVVAPEKPKNLKAVAAYDREPEMRAAGMSFKTSEAAMGKAVEGNAFKYLILPDEPVQFIVTADGYQPFAETVNLKEGETKAIEVKLIAEP